MLKDKARAIIEAHARIILLLSDMEKHTGVDYFRLLDMLADAPPPDGDMDAYVERFADAIEKGSPKPVGILSEKDRQVGLREHIEALGSGTLKVRIGGDPDREWRFCEMKTKE